MWRLDSSEEWVIAHMRIEIAQTQTRMEPAQLSSDSVVICIV